MEDHDEQFTEKHPGRPQLPSGGGVMQHRAGTIGRREFLRRGAAVAAAVVLTARPRRVAAEPPPEITKLRIVREPSLCIAPQYAAEELLKAEGFVDVEYVQTRSEPYRATGSGSSMGGDDGRDDPVAAGLADINTGMVGRLVVSIDAGDPIRILAGIHAGCFELFGTDRVRSIKDLKGRTVAVPGLAAATTCTSPVSRRTSVSMPTPTSHSSRHRWQTQRGCSPTEQSTLCSASRPFLRSSARARSVTLSSIAV
jgi:hypothetical protein